MKRLILLLALSAPAFGQRLVTHVVRPRAATTGPYLQWTWTEPSTSPVPAASYNLYQAVGQCPADGTIGTLTYTVIGLGLTQPSFIQSPIPTGVTCTYVTALSAVGVESSPSATFQSDTTAPSPPGTPSAEYVK